MGCSWRVVSVVLVMTLLGAGCSGAEQDAGVASRPPAIDEDGFIVKCLSADGWRIQSKPGTEDFGVELNELAKNADFAATENVCRQKLAAQLPSEPADVASEIGARALEASKSAYVGCLKGKGLSPKEDETFKTTGGSGGFSFSFPPDDQRRADFDATIRICGERATAAGDTTRQKLVDDLGRR